MGKLNFKNSFLGIVLIMVFFMVINKCSFHSLPKEKIQPFNVGIEESYGGNEYQITIKNPLECPSRFILSFEDEEVNKNLVGKSSILLNAKADTTIIIKDQGNLEGKYRLKFKWGDPSLTVQSTKIESLPFPEGEGYELLQGNNSNPTHNTKLSRYAFDFTMSIGDTITSAQNGYVVTTIDGYHGWGYSNKWKSYSNQVMIYDPETYLFTMYGHLKQHGSLVELGQYVKLGEPIALSGKTGLTQEEHLHFNVFQADNSNSGITSYELDSIGNYKVKELTRHQLIKH